MRTTNLKLQWLLPWDSVLNKIKDGYIFLSTSLKKNHKYSCFWILPLEFGSDFDITNMKTVGSYVKWQIFYGMPGKPTLQIHVKHIRRFDTNNGVYTKSPIWTATTLHTGLSVLLKETRVYLWIMYSWWYTMLLGVSWRTGPRLKIKTVFCGAGISIIKMRRLFLIIGIPIPVRRHIYHTHTRTYTHTHTHTRGSLVCQAKRFRNKKKPRCPPSTDRTMVIKITLPILNKVEFINIKAGPIMTL